MIYYSFLNEIITLHTQKLNIRRFYFFQGWHGIMINFLLLFINFLLLAAHFYRNGDIFIAIFFALFPLIYFVKHKINRITINVALIFSLFVWVETFFKLWNLYSKFDLSFKKTSIILSCVILFNLITIFLYRKALKWMKKLRN